MRISDNRLVSILEFYKKELIPVYGEAETLALFYLASEHYLRIPLKELKKQPDLRLHQSEILNIYDCAKALKKQIPLHYILGETFFMGLKLKVDPRVLIPRPETEELCELILKENPEARSVLDIGTGSGCIPLAIKKHLPTAEVQACDLSAGALELAGSNAKLDNLDIRFFKADVLNEAEFDLACSASFDLIVSNPPYVLEEEKEDMEKQVLEHEPHMALFVAGNDGILFYRKIIALCKKHLNKSGRLYFELNPLTADEVKQLALDSALFSEVEIIKDMSGKYRFLRAKAA